MFIYFVWGSTYSGLHFALQSFPPLLLSGLRNLLGGIGLFIFALRRKPEWPTPLEIRNAGIVGTMLVALSSGTIALGISSVSSGSAAVMVATVPLFATVIAAVAGRPVTKGEWAAVALGMVAASPKTSSTACRSCAKTASTSASKAWKSTPSRARRWTARWPSCSKSAMALPTC